jgi:hypothetical protein
MDRAEMEHLGRGVQYMLGPEGHGWGRAGSDVLAECACEQLRM